MFRSLMAIIRELYLYLTKVKKKKMAVQWLRHIPEGTE